MDIHKDCYSAIDLPDKTVPTGGRLIKRELRRRSAIEPIIGHLKAEGHLGRCYLKGRTGDAANVILSAVGHNFRRILAWFREIWCLFLFALWRTLPPPAPLNSAS